MSCIKKVQPPHPPPPPPKRAKKGQIVQVSQKSLHVCFVLFGIYSCMYEMDFALGLIRAILFCHQGGRECAKRQRGFIES